MFRHVTPLMFALAVIAGSAFIAGCGEDPEVAYQRELRAVGNQVAQALADIPTDTDSAIQPRQISTLARRLRDSADDAEQLDAPSEAAQRAQKSFAHGLRGVASALTDLSSDLAKSPDQTKQAERFVEFATDDSIQRSFDELENAQDAFSRAGFRVFAAPAPVVRPVTTRAPKSEPKPATP